MNQAIAVDTQIIMIACYMAERKPDEGHCKLLCAFDEKALLALDRFTEQEYRDNMGSQSKGLAFIETLAKNDRIQFYNRVPKERTKTRIALQEIRFNKKDLHFLRLALATELKWLVAEEPHFAKVRAMVKKNEGILIHAAQAACDLIYANLSTPPSV